MNTLTLEKHCWAEIDLTAMSENYEYIRRTVGGPVLLLFLQSQNVPIRLYAYDK